MGKTRDRMWLKKAGKKVEKIKAFDFSGFSREEMVAKTNDLKERVEKGEKLDAVLPEAFALVSEASKRVTGMTPYPVQMIGGIALHEGKIAELKTGEGKTLVAVMPAFLNALTGRGVHVVTVNDYLAKRDAENMGRIHEYLGLTVGCVLSGSDASQKKGGYGCDITYVTNSELGFDYLRDNMAKSAGMTVMRGLEYAIIDEADSILIDEARTPLIISGEGRDVSMLYTACGMLAKRMEQGEAEEFNKVEAMLGERQEETGDFIVHEKERAVTLTSDGVKKIEEFFRLERYADPENTEIQHGMENALKAVYVMKRDKDYIVREGEVFLVDEFTGRVMDGRQYSDGLHQAIEAKEGVKIQNEAQTVATTTYQSFFNKFHKVCGMTGTAYTERKEFRSTYGLDVVRVPTNRPVIRMDRDDRVYLTKKGKLQGVLEEVLKTHKAGQPVLIGTASIRSSEEVSALLTEQHIRHQVLNAKQDKEEADIIAGAGMHGAVTVATNMAGRGTDIVLDDEAKAAGGLKVIGTERHDARRIDDQLRGRSGRQGDPGESVFFLSLEDDMVRLFTTEHVKKAMAKSGVDEYECLTSRLLTSAARKAQKAVEENHFAQRKNVLDYDGVNDRLRELIYKERRKILGGESVEKEFKTCMKSAVWQIAEAYDEKGGIGEEALSAFFGTLFNTEKPGISGKGKKKIAEAMEKRAMEIFDACPAKKEQKEEHMRRCILYAIDTAWMELLKALEFLRQDVSFAGYAQKDAKSVYAVKAFGMYSGVKAMVHSTAVQTFFKTAPKPEVKKNVIAVHA